MAKTEYFELGTLSKPHGLKGAFHLFLDVDDPYEYEDLDAIFLQQGNEMVPYFVEDIQIRDNLNLITLEGVNSLDATKEFVGLKVFLPVKVLLSSNPDFKSKLSFVNFSLARFVSSGVTEKEDFIVVLSILLSTLS
jgi:ribosomal 30S subunit maturation factor RimM